MKLRFMVWDQGRDGSTMGIRVEDAQEVRNLGGLLAVPDVAGNYRNFQEFLDALTNAGGTPPPSYSRVVDVVWLATIGYSGSRVFPGRTLVASYNGTANNSGGFSPQCYCIVDSQGFVNLSAHDKQSLDVDYVVGAGKDTIVVHS